MNYLRFSSWSPTNRNWFEIEWPIYILEYKTKNITSPRVVFYFNPDSIYRKKIIRYGCNKCILLYYELMKYKLLLNNIVYLTHEKNAVGKRRFSENRWCLLKSSHIHRMTFGAQYTIDELVSCSNVFKMTNSSHQKGNCSFRAKTKIFHRQHMSYETQKTNTIITE